MSNTTDDDATDDTEHPRERVDWRLPRKLEDDLGNMDPPASCKWQNNLRQLLDGWAEAGGRVAFDAEADRTRLCSMYVSSETVRALERAANRLTRQTGKKWSTAAVVRLVWEQERGR